MMNIEKYSTVDKKKLDGQFYFQSLIEEALMLNILTEEEVERLQYECIEFLSRKIQIYNGCDNNSICSEVAEDIMKSVLYTVSIGLKDFYCADDAVEILKTSSISKLYEYGRKIIDRKIRAAKHIFSLVLKNKIDTDNYTYNSTVVDGINGFFKIYKPEYQAHEIHITADYPLCNPVVNLAGIEFIENYLNNIYLENSFCKLFSSYDIKHMLYGFDEGYSDLIFNIFEKTLIISIGCKIVDADFKSLNINLNQLEQLKFLFKNKTKDDVYELIFSASLQLCDELKIENNSLIKYINECLPSISEEIYCALKENIISRVFYYKRYPENNPWIQFSFGNKMDNKLYKNVVDEIASCRYFSDKIAIIEDKIHSLSDMEDLLIDTEFNENEILNLLSKLNIIEISALLKKYSYKSEFEAIYLSEAETKLTYCINEFIKTKSKEYQDEVEKTIIYLKLDM